MIKLSILDSKSFKVWFQILTRWENQREKSNLSQQQHQYQEHVVQFDLGKQISLKTLYLFSASVELQSFRFLNPKTPFLAQYSDPTLKHCATVNRKVQVDINRVSTNHRPKPKAIWVCWVYWVFLLRDFCSHLSLMSLLSKPIFPKQRSWTQENKS